MPPPVYVLDANVLIQAHRLHYPFDVFPGFWDSLLQYHNCIRIKSIDRIREELLAGNDPLESWVRNTLPASFFEDTEIAAGNFAEMMRWVNESSQFTPGAKAEFADVADGWLAAYARTHPGHVVVTHEQPKPEAKGRVPLPNVCQQFGVPYVNTIAMLRELQVRFTCSPTS